MEVVPAVKWGEPARGCLLTHRVNRAAGSAVAGLRAVFEAPALLAGLEDLADGLEIFVDEVVPLAVQALDAACHVIGVDDVKAQVPGRDCVYCPYRGLNRG